LRRQQAGLTGLSKDKRDGEGGGATTVSESFEDDSIKYRTCDTAIFALSVSAIATNRVAAELQVVHYKQVLITVGSTNQQWFN